ncbi:4-(cytidine 5'-diphospho)-2-C-methyl-D-erythritol kinase [Bacteroides ihuae]|uniref:4-(cytidine 5'-diphospho)-2-C-methyl-D-erythritol kinase n=1 Tax=Bacteroides ihuae TaxID=1852362 RepID=UPI0008DABBB6|nr:4-(cytidine 5'-diphospho)-2-C-methyl-D-erythritol kinase [Bacteroides ihuae]
MITFPNAKINLGLNITEKRADGYHNLETVFYPVPLEDALEITLSKSKEVPFTLHPSGISVAGELNDNLVVKAYLLLAEVFDLPPIDIYLYKAIPSGAGLGGGSADAAFMLKLLNNKFQLNLSTEKLEEYASRLGADCAFFIQNRPTFAEGIGDLFSPIQLSLKGYEVVIVKPPIFVSTREAFSLITPCKPKITLSEIISRPPTEWKELLENDFEKSVFALYPTIRKIKSELYSKGAVYSAMSGSGASVYGLFAPKTPLPEMEFSNSFYFHTCLD